MDINVKDTASTVAKWATVGGSVVIAVGAINTISGLAKSKELASGKVFMPAVTVLVAISAFSWAMTQPVTLIPQTGSKTV